LAELFADDQTPTHSDDLSDDEWSPFGWKHPKSWEDISTDGETPTHLRPIGSFSEAESPAHKKVFERVPAEGKKRWADLFENEPTGHICADQDLSCGKKRWMDLSEDEWTPAY